MKNKNRLNRFFLSNPFYRGMVEMGILIGSGICGLIFDWDKISIFPVTNVFGGVLVVLALAFHGWAEKDHKQAHEKAGKIEKIIDSGVYARIRHPLYLTLIVQNIGIALAFGAIITFTIALLTVIHWIITALKEEEMLSVQFPDDYKQYIQRVKWRMIPGIF